MDSVGPSIYERMGGERSLNNLIEVFYRIMATDPLAKECFATHHGRDINQSAEKLFMFLSGILGGPPLYHEKIGHPRLRMRHGTFSIGEKEADQWLYCMEKAMEEVKLDQIIQAEMTPYFRQVTDMLRNR